MPRPASSSDRRAKDDGPLDTLEGVLERITFQNAETHFTVAKLRVEPPKGGVFAKQTPLRPGELATVVGTLVAVDVGETLRCEGRWETKDQWGAQFRIARFTPLTPRTSVGIERYLGSGLVPGVGPALAKRIVEAFGDRTFSVIEEEPERLRDVEGIGAKRSTLLVAAWKEHRAVRDVMVFLQGHGIGPAHAARIYKTYGDKAMAKVAENPYKLADDVWGIGFATADRIAQSLGLPRESPKRADAGVRFVLSRAAEEGHVCLPRRTLVDEAAKALGLEAAAIDAAVSREVEAGALVEERRPWKAIDAEPYVWGAGLHAAEKALAQGLRALRDAPRGLPPIKTEAAIDWVEKRRGVSLGRSQREALRLVLESKVAVVTGGPGVGKTTITASLLDIVEAKGVKVRLAAPTGRAAKRMEEATGREAKTIHRLLKWNPRSAEFEHGRESPLPLCDLLVLDEASMVDLPLMQRVVDALPLAAHLVIVGDQDQLPSVGPGSVLGDLIASRAIPTARLTEIFRQAAASRIVTTAHAVNKGEVPELFTLEGGGDFHWVPAESPEKALAEVRRLVGEVLPRLGHDPVRDVQVLAPMHRGQAGVQALNDELQKALSARSLQPEGSGRGFLSPGGREGPRVERFGKSLGKGDKVLQLRNDYDKEVYNGDVGVVVEVDTEAHEVVIAYDSSRSAVRYKFSELDEVELAYCCSIHKSQGSEYPCVVVPLVTQHYMMLQRNLLYTAITRGKRRVVLVGQLKALQMAVKNDEKRRRFGFLAERVREG